MGRCHRVADRRPGKLDFATRSGSDASQGLFLAAVRANHRRSLSRGREVLMRILHVFKTYLPESIGGIEQVIYQLCQSTEAHGVESEVLTLSPDPHPAQLKVGNHRVHRVK